ncbi:MAG: ROK family protein [Actinobacteria bacterium]|nr:ROK family protein [Actinomycetota bacterium]
MSTLAVDIGATKFAASIVTQTGDVLHRREAPSSQLWDGLFNLLQETAKDSESKIEKIGIGSAGPINTETGCISPVNISAWRNFPLVPRIKEFFPNTEIAMVGDAVALAVAEHAIGAGKGSVNMLGMVVSTGIGGGIIVRDKPLLGDYGNAGFFGHNVVGDYDGKCNCGRKGCVEGYSSGPSMVRFANSLGWEGDDFRDLAKDATSGDAYAIKAIDFGTDHLAKAIVNISQLFDLYRVVVGGGVIEAGEIYWKPLENALASHSTSLNLVEPIKLIRAQLQRDAGLIGAAMVVGLE